MPKAINRTNNLEKHLRRCKKAPTNPTNWDLKSYLGRVSRPNLHLPTHLRHAVAVLSFSYYCKLGSLTLPEPYTRPQESRQMQVGHVYPLSPLRICVPLFIFPFLIPSTSSYFISQFFFFKTEFSFRKIMLCWIQNFFIREFCRN